MCSRFETINLQIIKVGYDLKSGIHFLNIKTKRNSTQNILHSTYHSMIYPFVNQSINSPHHAHVHTLYISQLYSSQQH